jgi:hypothetical protein
MPIDPSIVSNAFVNAANNMPDMNALMQQRVQGAENVYKIETARQAQAAEAEKEAAQQAAEAMLPAVASAFSDPSDAGLDAATSLLPPEVAEAFTPFMQRLKGIADPKMRMTILRAELAKDEEGKFILSQLEPSANMRLQEATAGRRAALDERRLALEEAKLAAEGAGGGKVAFRETDAEGNVRLYDAQGIEIGMLPKAGKPAPATAGAPGDKQQARQGVDGTLSRIMDQYKILKKEKAIVSAENTAAENIGARVSTKLGTSVGRTVGTKAQSARDTIANLRQALLADIKAATGMSSKAIDSNVELKSFLDSLGDPDQSLETIQATLAELSIKYGLGSLSEDGAEATTTSESGDVDTNNPLLSDGVQ